MGSEVMQKTIGDVSGVNAMGFQVMQDASGTFNDVLIGKEGNVC